MQMASIELRVLRRCCAALALAALLLSATTANGASKSPVRARNGMVASSEPLASKIGVDILKKGGNAVDAAVAVGFALAVTLPEAGNLGGGGFMMIRLKNGEAICIDYREYAPAAAHKDIYLNSRGEVIPKSSTVGYRASGVPGTVAGLCLALRTYGRLPLKAVIQPAIDQAEKGFPVSHHLSQSLKSSANLLGAFPDSRRIYLRDGKYYEGGDLFIQPELAWSLKVIRDQGSDGFYRGPIAEKIERTYKKGGGWITQRDLTDYRPKLRKPLEGTYRNHSIVTVPPPSSGGVAILQILNILEGYTLTEFGQGSSETLHLTAEAIRRAFRDRAELMGDPDFVDLPVGALTSKKYAGSLRENIQLSRASLSPELSPRSLPKPEASDTTHYSVVDREGNAVSNTYTLNGSYGSGVTVEGTGIVMNNEMDDFTVKAGVPNAYGLIQGEANAIAPRKRPLSAMTPTFVTKDGKLFLVIGSPGGPTIISTVIQVILNVVDFGLTIQEAVDAPRIHHQWLPDELKMEPRGFAMDVILALRNRGHNVNIRGLMGDAQGILLDPKGQVLYGASDPRGGGTTVGY